MNSRKTVFIEDIKACVDYTIATLGKKIVLAMPLALGKSHAFANEMYRRAKADPEMQLLMATALSLEKPTASSELERRMLEPIVDRIWKGVPDFEYMLDLRAGRMPANVTLKEFYFRAGSFNHVASAQQNHYSSNYTHVARDMMNEVLEDKSDWGFVFCQLAAKQVIDGKTWYSDSCNADLNLDLKRLLPMGRELGIQGLHIAQVNSNLPFMYGDAVSDETFFDVIVDNEAYDAPLFSVPKEPVTVAEHMIGLHVSALIKDGGTLQVGIGSLGDAISNALLMRHHHSKDYRSVIADLDVMERYGALVDRVGGLGPFEKGLYGSTEMLVGVFLDLYDGGILKRKVYADPIIQRHINEGLLSEAITPKAAECVLEAGELNPIVDEKTFASLQQCGFFKSHLRYENFGVWDNETWYAADLRDDGNRQAILDHCIGERLTNGIICHGSFFIGANRFYEYLRSMSEEERKQFIMTGVAYVNQLYGDETIKRLQRKDGRFINAGMKVTLMGHVASDALENGTVISGVGGQYNFVSMAHALEDARSILMVRSTKDLAHGADSNVVFNYGHTTIPRHLKDIVVTEYGIADLRGKVDHEVVNRLLNIADSRFQPELLERAKKAGKVAPDYQIPECYRNNYPEALAEKLAPYKAKGFFRIFPAGTEFTDEEIVLGRALRGFKARAAASRLGAAAGVVSSFFRPVPEQALPYLKRIGLDAPETFRERLLQKVVLCALADDGAL